MNPRAMLFYSKRPERQSQARAAWAAICPGAPFMAVDDLPDAVLHGQSGLFGLVLIDGDELESSAVLIRFMRLHRSNVRLLVFGSSHGGNWSQLEEHLRGLSLERVE